MNDLTGKSSAIDDSKTGALIVRASSIGNKAPRMWYGLTRQARAVSPVMAAAWIHQRRRDAANDPGASAASISAKTSTTGPSTKRPCVLTQKTWTTGTSQPSHGKRSQRVKMARSSASQSSVRVSGRMYMRPLSTSSAGSHASSMTHNGHSRRRAVMRKKTARQVIAHLARFRNTIPPS